MKLQKQKMNFSSSLKLPQAVTPTAIPTAAPSTTAATLEPLTQIYIERFGYTHIKAHIIIPKLTGSLSIAGSTFIIQDVLRNPTKRSKSTYHRIMLGLSTLDILVSFMSHFLTSWPMPRGYYTMAVGSVISCDAVAAIACIGHFGIPMYNCSLATYCLLELKYLWVDRRIKEVERWFHVVPLLTGVGFSVFGLISRSFGPILSVCWITTSYPFDCHEPDSNEKCIRGSNLTLTSLLKGSYFLLQIFAIIYISACMTIVYKNMRNIERNAERFSFNTTKRNVSTTSITATSDKEKGRHFFDYLRCFNQRNNIDNNNNNSNGSNNNRGQTIERQMMKRSRWIMIQGISYSAALIVTLIFPMIGIMHYIAVKKTMPTLDLLITIFFPLQGFFNAIIYLIPFFRKRRSELKTKKKNMIDQTSNLENASELNLEPKGRMASSLHSSRRMSLGRFSISGLTKIRYRWWEEEFEIISPGQHKESGRRNYEPTSDLQIVEQLSLHQPDDYDHDEYMNQQGHHGGNIEERQEEKRLTSCVSVDLNEVYECHEVEHSIHEALEKKYNISENDESNDYNSGDVFSMCNDVIDDESSSLKHGKKNSTLPRHEDYFHENHSSKLVYNSDDDDDDYYYYDSHKENVNSDLALRV